QKHHHIAAVNLSHPIGQLIHKQPVLVLEHRQHARTLHPHRLVQKHDDERRHQHGHHHVPHPGMEMVLFRCASPVTRPASPRGPRSDTTRNRTTLTDATRNGFHPGRLHCGGRRLLVLVHPRHSPSSLTL